MAIASLAPFGLPLGATYSGDIATSRYSTQNTSGLTVGIDIIQSLPKKGRWRHVVRCTMVPPSLNADGSSDGRTFTITMDVPARKPASEVRSELLEFLLALDPVWDEIALGQQ